MKDGVCRTTTRTPRAPARGGDVHTPRGVLCVYCMQTLSLVPHVRESANKSKCEISDSYLLLPCGENSCSAATFFVHLAGTNSYVGSFLMMATKCHGG